MTSWHPLSLFWFLSVIFMTCAHANIRGEYNYKFFLITSSYFRNRYHFIILKKNIYLTDYVYLLACDNSHVNTASGWSYDPVPTVPIEGSSNPKEPFHTQCKNSYWYGWIDPGDLAMRTVLYGNGVASFKYGNCHSIGRVAVYLNDVEISSASPSSQENAIFSFHDQDVLKIVEHGASIQLYTDFNIINCSGKLFFGYLYQIHLLFYVFIICLGN